MMLPKEVEVQQKLDDLLAEFDERQYIPTIMASNPQTEAQSYKERLTRAIDALLLVKAEAKATEILKTILITMSEKNKENKEG